VLGVSLRVRLLFAVAAGVAAGVGAASLDGSRIGALSGIDALNFCFLLGVWLTIWPMGPEETERYAKREDPALALRDLLLTGAALRPVNIMRRDAERLSASASLEALPLGVARDELSRLAGTLNAFIERNRQTIEREKQMLSDASHELRTPIAILSAQLELAASPGRDLATMRRELAGARRTSARLATLTTNLLELAKIETGHRQEPTPWRSLVQELAASIDRARLLAQPRGISVDFEVLGIDDEAQSYALSGVSFASAIDNLLVNAIAATPREGVVHVGVVQGMNGLILTVTDTGRGMPAEFIPIAFDRFTRPDGSRQRALGGSGLGLAIVHAIATAAGGTARIENRDPGLAVMVELPKAGFTPPAG